jgi:hypothetical protein
MNVSGMLLGKNAGFWRGIRAAFFNVLGFGISGVKPWAFATDVSLSVAFTCLIGAISSQ